MPAWWWSLLTLLLPIPAGGAVIHRTSASQATARGAAAAAARAAPGTVKTDNDVLSQLASEAVKSMYIEVLSSPKACHVRVDGRTVLHKDKVDLGNHTTFFLPWMDMDGMYAVSLHPCTGKKTGQAFAFGHTPHSAFYSMDEFVRNVQPGRILVFCVLAESALALDALGETLFRALDSAYIPDLQIRSMSALIVVKGGPVLAEGYRLHLDALDIGHPGAEQHLTTSVTPPSHCAAGRSRHPHRNRLEYARSRFCDRYDGYPGLCDMDNPTPLRFPVRTFEDGSLFKYPVVILAANRPQYLLRCLQSLLPNRGLDFSKVVVYVDGEFQEVRELLQLLNVTYTEHIVELIGEGTLTAGSKIAYNYKYAIESTFNRFPDADKIVLLEEDLDVSPDFISFFHQTQHLLDIDVSIYCISAWNDHGYNHTVGDPALLYRVGFLPGLGWLLKRSLFFDELLPTWPRIGLDFDWDVWLRLSSNRKGRDCVIPDVSRTYHFGFSGNHVHANMQYKFFFDHAFNTIPDVKLKDVDKMVFPRYEEQIINLLNEAIPLDGGEGTNVSCKTVIPSDTKNKTYIMFFAMENRDDTGTWEKMASCLNLWDLDARGDRRGIWRFWYNGNHIIAIGVPYAPITGYVMTKKGEGVSIFTGKRSEKMKWLGRWPPGYKRDSMEDRRRRYRLTAEALGAINSTASEVMRTDDKPG